MTIGERTLLLQQRRRSRPTFHQLKILQAWQGWRLNDLIAACHDYGYTGIVVKALDGAVWMRTYDSSPDALANVEQVAEQAAALRAHGLYYFIWTNPIDQGDIALQSTLYGQAARAADGLLIDVEPYAQFWGANNPDGDARQFMLWLRAEAPTAFIGLQPDPRPARLAEIRPEEWLPYVDALCGQHYWSDFGTDPASELSYAVQLGNQHGVPVLPTLPGNAPLSGFPWSAIADLPGFVVWRWGSTPPVTLDALGGAAVAGFTSRRIGAR